MPDSIIPYAGLAKDSVCECPRVSSEVMWVIYVHDTQASNWIGALQEGVWGFTDGRIRQNAGLRDINAGDTVTFVGPILVGAKKLPGWPRVREHLFTDLGWVGDYMIGSIMSFVVSEGYLDTRTQSFSRCFLDVGQFSGRFPHRFRFSTAPLFSVSRRSFTSVPVEWLRMVRSAVLCSPIKTELSQLNLLIKSINSTD